MWRRGDFLISTEPDRLDLELVHRFHSLNFGMYHGDDQVGFARVVTDYATFAWVADVFVVDAHRGRGLGKWLMETVVSHPELASLRRWLLATVDAHALYEPLGFRPLGDHPRFMAIEG